MILCYTCKYVNANILNNLINLCSYSATSGACVCACTCLSWEEWLEGDNTEATGGGQSSGGRSGRGGGGARGAGGLWVWRVYPVGEVEMKARNPFALGGNPSWGPCSAGEGCVLGPGETSCWPLASGRRGALAECWCCLPTSGRILSASQTQATYLK